MNDRVEKERGFWDSFAKKYDGFIERTVSDSYRVLMENLLADSRQSHSLLEIGTGTGMISISLSNEVSRIIAIDISPEMIKVAQQKCKEREITNIDFRLGDSCNLEFRDESFDLVIASNVLHLLFQPGKALQEIKRVLTTNGIIIVPTYCHGENFKSHLLSRLMGLFGFRARSRWSVNSFKELITRNGFRIVEFTVIKDKIPLAYLKAGKDQPDT